MLEIIFQGFLEWAYSLVLEIWEFFSTSMLNLMSMDFAYLESHIPILPVIQQIMLAVGWALLIGNLVFQSIRSMLTGLGFEAEDPKLLFTRTFVFSFLLLASPQICKIALNFTGAVIRLLEIPNAVIITTLNEGMFAGLGTAWVLVIICGLVVMYQSIKLFVEMVERYFILSMLTITSPLAFGMGGSKSTSGIFSGWCKMYGSMCLLMILNVVFVKILLSVLAYSPFGVDVLPWMALIMAVVRTAKKADSIVTRIGLNPAITNEPRFPGVLSMIVARTMMSGVAKVISQNGTNGGQRSGTRRGGPAPSGASGNRGSSGAGGQNGSAGRNGNAGRNGGAGNSGTHTNPANSGTSNPAGTSTSGASASGNGNAAGNGGHPPNNHNTPPEASGNNPRSQNNGDRSRRRGGRSGAQGSGAQGRNRQANANQGSGQRQNRSTDGGSPNGTTRQDSVYSAQTSAASTASTSSTNSSNSPSSQNSAAYHSTTSTHSAGPVDNRQSGGNAQNQDEQRTRRTSVPPGERRSPVYTSPDAASRANLSGNPRDTGSQTGAAPSENSTTPGTEPRYSGKQRDEEAKARRDEAPTTLSAERDEKQAKSGISASRFTNRTGTEQSNHAQSSLTKESHAQDSHAQDVNAQADRGQPNTPKMPADVPAVPASGETDTAPKPTRFTNRPHDEVSSNKSGQTLPSAQTKPVSASANGEKRTENGTVSSRFTGRADAAHDSRTQNRQTQSISEQTSQTRDQQAQGSHTQDGMTKGGHARDSQAKTEASIAGQARMPSGAPAVLPKPAEGSNGHTSGKGETTADTTRNTRFTHTGGNVPNATEKKPGTSPTGISTLVDSATHQNRTAVGPAAVLSGQEKAEHRTETRFTSRPVSSDGKQSPQESREETASLGMGPTKAGVPAGNVTAGARTKEQVTAKTATTVTGETTAETSTRATTRPTGTAAGSIPSASSVTGRSGTEKPVPHQPSDSGEKSSGLKPGAIPKKIIPAVGSDARSGSPTGTAGTGSPSEAGKQVETRFTSVHKNEAPQSTAAGGTVSGIAVPGNTVPGGAVSRNGAHGGNHAVHAPSIVPASAASGYADRKTTDSSVKGKESSGTPTANTRFTNLHGSAPRPSVDGTKSGTEVPRSPETHSGGMNIGAQTVPSGKAGETRQNDTRMTQRDNQSAHKKNHISERDARTAQQDTRSTQRESRTSLRTEADASRNHAAPPVKTAPHNKADAPRPGTAGTGTSLDTRQTVRLSGSESSRDTRQSMEVNRCPVSSPMPLCAGDSVPMPTHERSSTVNPQSTRIPRPEKGQQEIEKAPNSDGMAANGTQNGSAGVNLHIPNVTGGGAATFHSGADRPARGEHPANQGTTSENPDSAVVAGQRPVPAQQEHPQEHPTRRELPNTDHTARPETAANSVRTEETRQHGQGRTPGLAIVLEGGLNAAGPAPVQQAKGSTAPPVRGTGTVPVTRQTMRGQDRTVNTPSSVSRPQAAVRNAAQRPVPAQPGRNGTPQGRSIPPRSPQYSGQGVRSGTAGTAPNPMERNPRSTNGTPVARNGGTQQNQNRQRPNPAGRNDGIAGNAGAIGKPTGTAIDSPKDRNPVQSQNPQNEQKRRQQSGGDEKKPLFGLFGFGKNQSTRQSGRNQSGGNNPDGNYRR